jgi:hypothetical protein
MTKPYSFQTKTVRGTRRQILFFDQDVFNEKIVLSVSMLISEDDLPYDSLDTDELAAQGVTHYNTIHEDTSLEQSLEDIAIVVHPKPLSTKIIGAKRVGKGSSFTYNIDRYYDPKQDFGYEWTLSGNASFSGSVRNTKTVTVNFGDEDGKVVLMCKITNKAGCYRYIIKNIYIGIVSKDMLVVRNTYF